MSTRIAVIDIGTNSTLLLIAEADSNDTIKTVDQYAETTRLGYQVGQTGIIGQTGEQNNLKALQKYQSIAEKYHTDSIIAVGTQVFRKAGNADEIIESIYKNTGLKVKVLTEQDEAEFGFKGAVSGIQLNDCMVMDIGGGSTELTLEENGIKAWISLPIGAVVLTEKYLKMDPPDPAELNALQLEIKNQIPKIWRAHLARETPLICIGGTITTLTAIHLHLETYDALQVDGFEFTLADIDHLLNQLTALPLESRKKLIPFDTRRADIILAGSLILRTIVQMTRVKKVLVSDRGLRHGLAIRELNNVR